MGKEINRLIAQKHEHLRAIDFIEKRIAEITHQHKFGKYKANEEQRRLE